MNNSPMNIDQIQQAVQRAIQDAFGDVQATLGCILGSGLGVIADQLEARRTLSYEDIPYLKESSVEGHAGQLCVGVFAGQTIVCLQGRPHWYEGVSAETFIALISALRCCGVQTVIVSNAAGAIRSDLTVGDVVLITDHINLQFKNPLVGIAPPPFISMDVAYDRDLRKRFLSIALEHNLPLKEGVYCGVLGPSFETPAEIRAFQTMGADVVAMSMIPEVLVSRYFNCRVVGLSVVANPAAGLSDQVLGHDVTLAGVKEGCQTLVQLLSEFIQCSTPEALASTTLKGASFV